MTRVVATIAMLAIAGCTPSMEMERVPTEAEIRSWGAMQAFLVRPGSITGVYQNIDVDSVIFHYRSGASGEQAFWQGLDHSATAEGWVPVPEGGVGRRAYRRLKPRGSAQVSSAEEVRIVYTASRVVVGWVQSDQSGEPRPVGEASEGRFAERVLWPKFEALVAEKAG